LLALAGIFFLAKGKSARSPTCGDGFLHANPSPARLPKTFPSKRRLKDSVIAAGDYLVRQQLPNGELSYQVDFMSGERAYSPSHVRLMAGTGALFTVCRVSADLEYCRAGDLPSTIISKRW